MDAQAGDERASLRDRRVLVLVATGVDDASLRKTWRSIVEAEGDLLFVSVAGDPNVVTFAGSEAVGSFRANAVAAGTDADDFDGLVVPHGARMPDEFGRHEAAHDLVRRFSTEGKPIAVQGASARILFDLGLAEGRVLSIAPPLRSAAHAAGAQWVDDLVFDDDGLVSCGSGRAEDLDAFCTVMIEAVAATTRLHPSEA